ncbi:DUF2264 domain-containing protein [Microvirga sp. STS02]|uniref:DUF2264 domain-containing protein n=1 Tax=Hymenobacter negativus TaxID=2795026 RepID=UPI0018DB8B51|nr:MULTISPECIES: DUF2264 domain-containing protein [Bacteria]MBH8568607.1 DUF2264 domain-containing protein [Hymenobacter negativus]MBR7208341.1 DUF2264 domain-containing protein [Microvirga sp. STS02]
MKITGLLLGTLAALAAPTAYAQPVAPAFTTAVTPPATRLPLFQVQQPDKKLSPFTGMTRRHWQDAARYLLGGAFSYVHQLDDPMQFPKQPGKSYPRTAAQVPTEKLEGLCRTLFMAAPLLKEAPGLTLNGIKVGDYYRHQLAQLVNPASPAFIQPRAKDGGPSQNLVEFGGLSVALFAAPEILWEPLPQATKDALAATMLSYGDGPTVPQNWRYFNIFILSFYKSRGYAVNEKLMEEYLQKQLTHYRGEGWYHDAPTFDYYSMWAFQMYGRLWSEYYGRAHYPEIAAQLTANFAPLKDNYPYQFGRDGSMIMWGRSITYRFAAVVPFPLMGLHPEAGTNFGWMRRIASGGLLQFLENPDFLQDNIPTLGFYGSFDPAVQAYSCRGSVFWMAKAFLGLLVPADSPFWTATENEGPWTKELKPGTVFNEFEAGPNILVTDYPNSGAAEIRVPSAQPASDANRGNENYNRLSYNSAFPWQADGPNGEVAMDYVFRTPDNKWEPLRLYTFKKFENGVYYRDAELETNHNIKLHLAEITLPNGILRLDQNLSTEPVAARLGHYSLPNLTGTIRRSTRKVGGYEAQLIDNGNWQLALVPLSGWTKTETLTTTGLNPVKPESAVINVSAQFAPAQPALYATLMLWKKSGETWTEAELMPVKKLLPTTPNGSATVTFRDGSSKTIKYD